MRVGVFGGTFDPPHVGHLILAELARDELGLQEILWVTAGAPPHKQANQVASTQHRLAMVELAIRSNDAFKASRIDIDRLGPHYTVDMLRLITEERPDDQLFLMLGADSLLDLPQWNRPELLNDYAELAVLARQGFQPDLSALSSQYPRIYREVIMLNLPLIEISGQMIRRRIISGQTVKYLVASDVEFYIRSNDLYH